MNKKILIAIFIVAVLAVGTTYLFKRESKAPGAEEQAKSFNVEKKDLPPSSVPKGFQADLPTPAGAVVGQNYEATGSDGRVQSTRSFTTPHQTVQQLLTLYRDYFTGLAWTDLSEKGKNVLVFRRTNDTVLVSVTPGEAQRSVEITLTQSPAQ